MLDRWELRKWTLTTDELAEFVRILREHDIGESDEEREQAWAPFHREVCSSLRDVYDRDDAEESLREVGELVASLSDILNNLPDEVNLTLVKYLGSTKFDPLSKRAKFPNIFLLTNLLTTTKDMLPTAISKLKENTEPGRHNMDAVRLVEAASKLWEQSSRRVPKALNDHAPFSQFLRDLADFLQLGTTPRSAFNAWKEVHRRRQLKRSAMHA